MSISEWVYNQELRGRNSFSLEEVRNNFSNISDAGIKSALARMVASGITMSVYRGFYVIVPVQYRLKRNVPVVYYVDELMHWLGRNYYVGLLSAAAIYGASHQRAMLTQIFTDRCELPSIAQNSPLKFIARPTIPEKLLVLRNGEMGVIRYSSPELTAADLVQFSQHIGGYQRAATVLAELVEAMDMSKMTELLSYSTTATMQRLGAILELVLCEQEKANALFQTMNEAALTRKSILMSNAHPKSPNATPNRWHVNMNIDIEIDEL